MKNKIRIGDRWVGEGEPTLIIAEVGSNHNQDFEQAIKLIGVAAEAGADVVKFQTYSADNLYSKFAPRLSEMEGRSKQGETPYELIKRIEMPREWLKLLKKQCEERGIMFASTPFDIEAVEELNALGVPFFKIASYDTEYVALLRAIGKTRKPVIISTGNSDLATIEYALNILQKAGTDEIVLLHCVSQYPALCGDVNLKAIETLREAFKFPVGFSDHTTTSVSAVGAVALKACVIEKHFTLNKNHPGPDHPFSLEPDELKALISNIREIELALGDGVKRIQASEEENYRLGRRSLHAACNIKTGSKITREMLSVKRPGLGIKPRFEDIVVGRTARVDIKADQWITWEMV